MNIFQDILSKVQERLTVSTHQKEIVQRIIFEHIGVTISLDAISYKDGVITLRVVPTIKMAIRLKQSSIIDLLTKEGIKTHTIA